MIATEKRKHRPKKRPQFTKATQTTVVAVHAGGGYNKKKRKPSETDGQNSNQLLRLHVPSLARTHARTSPRGPSTHPPTPAFSSLNTTIGPRSAHALVRDIMSFYLHLVVLVGVERVEVDDELHLDVEGVRHLRREAGEEGILRRHGEASVVVKRPESHLHLRKTEMAKKRRNIIYVSIGDK